VLDWEKKQAKDNDKKEKAEKVWEELGSQSLRGWRRGESRKLTSRIRN